MKSELDLLHDIYQGVRCVKARSPEKYKLSWKRGWGQKYLKAKNAGGKNKRKSRRGKKRFVC